MTPPIPPPGSLKPGSSTDQAPTPPKPGTRTSRRSSSESEARPSPSSESQATRPVDEQPADYTKREKQQIGDLANLYRILGGVVLIFNKDIAAQMITGADVAGTAWIDLGRRNPKVKAYVDSITSASVWAAVVSVHMQMLSPAISIPFGGPPTPPSSSGSPIFSPDFSSDEVLRQAAEMMMQSQPNGGPTDTVSVKTVPSREVNGDAPIGSAEYHAPPIPISPDTPFEAYPFPVNSAPPQG